MALLCFSFQRGTRGLCPPVNQGLSCISRFGQIRIVDGLKPVEIFAKNFRPRRGTRNNTRQIAKFAAGVDQFAIAVEPDDGYGLRRSRNCVGVMITGHSNFLSCPCFSPFSKRPANVSIVSEIRGSNGHAVRTLLKIMGDFFDALFCPHLTNETQIGLFRQPNETLKDQIAIIEFAKGTDR
ncbi:MAG: hypothetical protein NXI27_23710 [Alphaproteobacteria bacterium]|nr:hypothetical protein [Alphaproteobacteria bacterium]